MAQSNEPRKLNRSVGRGQAAAAEEDDLMVDVQDLVPVAPDGGWGWVIVGCTFMIGVLVDGCVFSYGILLPAFASYFHSSTVEAAWIGSLFSGIYMLVGPLAAGFMNKFGARPVVIGGSVFLSSAFFLSSWATSLTYLAVSYGCLGGIGAGFAFIPTSVIVSHYFEKKRATAMGLAAAGSGLGAIVMPFACAALLDAYGWSGTLTILSGLLLQCCIFGALLRPLPPPRAPATPVIEIMEADRVFLSAPSAYPLDVVEEEDSPSHDGAFDSNRALKSDAAKTGSAPKLLGEPPPVLRLISQSKHLTAGSYARSISRLSSVVPKNASATERLKSYISTVNPKEFQRPFSRQDILYSGSISNLEEFHKSKENFAIYRSDTVSAPQDVDVYETVDGDIVMAKRKGFWETLSCVLPAQMVNVLSTMFNFGLMKNPKMILICALNVLAFIGFYVPFVYTPAYAESQGCTAGDANQLLSIMGIANTVGRVFFGWLSDRRFAKALTLSNWSLCICGVLTALFPLYGSYLAIAAYAVLFGFIIAAFVTLTSIVLVEEMGLSNLSNSFGLLLLFRGIASVIGSPIAGALSDITGDYKLSFIVNGIFILLAGLMGFPMVFKGFGGRDRPADSGKEGADADTTNADMDKILDLLCDEND